MIGRRAFSSRLIALAPLLSDSPTLCENRVVLCFCVLVVRSGMSDPAFDRVFRQEGEASSGPGSTFSSRLPLEGRAVPALYLDGEFMAYLDGEEALDNLGHFLSWGLISKLSAEKHRAAGVGDSSPLWLKVQGMLHTLDNDLRQEARYDHFASETEHYRFYTYWDSTVTVPVDNDDVGAAASDETLASLSSPSASEMSRSTATLFRYSADFYLYDDTTGEIQREQATEYEGGRRPSTAVQQQQHGGADPEAEHEEPLSTPQSPSSVASGHGVSSKIEEAKQADSEASPPLSPPAPKIA